MKKWIGCGVLWVLLGLLGGCPPLAPAPEPQAEVLAREPSPEPGVEPGVEPRGLVEPRGADAAAVEPRPEAGPEVAMEPPRPPDLAPLSKDDPAAAARNQARPYLKPAPHALGMKDLEGVVEPIRRKFQLPSLIGAVYKGGKLVAMGASGARKAFGPAHIQLDDKFHLGSCTKAMTATLAARLVEQGKVRWETTLADAFAAWRAQIHPSLQKVTLLQLLSNRSGLTGQIAASHPALWRQLWNTKKAPHQARLEFARALLKDKPQYEPNTRYAYSNAGFMIAGAVLEAATQTPWERLLQTQLFEPLGMASCGFGAPASAGKTDHPWGHQVKAPGSYTPIPPGPQSDNPPGVGPAGTVHCSLRDWSAFLALHLHGAQGKTGLLLKPQSFQTLHKARSTSTPYALGWLVMPRSWAKGDALFHNGTNTLFFASVWIAPELDSFYFAATNQGGAPAAQALDAFYGALQKLGY